MIAVSTVNVDGCMHPGSFGGICIHCGQKVDGESGVPFGYIHKVQIVSNDYLGDTNNIDLDSCRMSQFSNDA
jgi:RNA polymerase II C-terminal domain phosphatase-like 3/4